MLDFSKPKEYRIKKKEKFNDRQEDQTKLLVGNRINSPQEKRERGRI